MAKTIEGTVYECLFFILLVIVVCFGIPMLYERYVENKERKKRRSNAALDDERRSSLELGRPLLDDHEGSKHAAPPSRRSKSASLLQDGSNDKYCERCKEEAENWLLDEKDLEIVKKKAKYRGELVAVKVLLKKTVGHHQ